MAEEFFKKLNKNKKYSANSAGVFPYKRKDLVNDKEYMIEKKIGKEFSLKFNKESKGINSSILGETDILVIVADDIPSMILKNERVFKGKVIVWKVADVKKNDKNKEIIAKKAIIEIKKKVEEFVRKLK